MHWLVDRILEIALSPGVIIHEIAHRFFCDILGVKVYAVCYFTLSSDETSGCVIREGTSNIKHTSLICFGPLIINTLICLIFTFPFMAFYSLVGDFFAIPKPFFAQLGYLFLAWIGFAAGACAFPSDRDLENILSAVEQQGAPLSLTLDCLISVMKFLNFLSSFYVGFLYSYGISLILPSIFLR